MAGRNVSIARSNVSNVSIALSYICSCLHNSLTGDKDILSRRLGFCVQMGIQSTCMVASRFLSQLVWHYLILPEKEKHFQEKVFGGVNIMAPP